MGSLPFVTLPGDDHRRSTWLAAGVLLLLIGVDVALMDQRVWTVAMACLAAVLLGVLARGAGLGVEDLGLSRHRLGYGVRLGGLVSGLVVLGYAIAVWVPQLASAFDDDRTPPDLGSVLTKVVVVIPLRTVLLEELAFRGVLWGWLARSRGERVAGWGSSLAFGLWHVPPGLVVLETNEALSTSSTGGAVLVVGGIVVGTAAAGMVFAELRRRTGSLIAPALLHWTVNSAGTVAGYVMR